MLLTIRSLSPDGRIIALVSSRRNDNSLKLLIDGDDEEDEDDQLTTGKENEAYAQEEKPTEKVEEYSETKENGDVNFDFLKCDMLSFNRHH